MQNHELLQGISTAINFKPVHITQPIGWIAHMPFAAALVSELKPKLLVELGTHSGNSYFTFCQSVKVSQLGAVCYAVDTWEGDSQAGWYDDKIYQSVAKINNEHYATFSYLLRRTFDNAVSQFADGSIDILHIDGLHTYEACKHDYETWLPKVKKGGVILFHDICSRHDDFGVWKLWGELQSIFPHTMTFSHSSGLGVLLNDQKPPKNKFLASLLSPEFQHYTQIFETLGNQIVTEFAEEEAKRIRANILAQLYVADGENAFTEACSAQQIYTAGKITILRFENIKRFSCGDMMRLRFDPANCPCRVQILRAALLSVNDNSQITRLADFTTTRSITSSANIISINDELLDIISQGEDPQMYLAPIQITSQEDLVFEVELVTTTGGWRELSQCIKQIADGYSATKKKLEDERETHEKLDVLGKEYAGQIAVLEQQSSTMQSERKKLIEELKEKNNESDALKRQLEVDKEAGVIECRKKLEESLKEAQKKRDSEVGALRRQMQDKDVEASRKIGALDEKAKQHEQATISAEATASALRRKLEESLKEAQKEKDAEVSALRRQMQAKEVEAARKIGELDQKAKQREEMAISAEATASVLRKKLEESLKEAQKERDAEVSVLRQQMLDKEVEASRKIEELDQKVKQGEEVAISAEATASALRKKLEESLKEAKKERDAEVSAVRQQMLDKEVEASRKIGELAEKQRQNAQSALLAEEEFAHLNQLLDEIRENMEKKHTGLFFKIFVPFQGLKRWFHQREGSQSQDHFWLDTPRVKFFSKSKNPLQIAGWFVDAKGRPAHSIRIRVGKHHVTCSSVARPDVVAHFKSQGIEVADGSVGFHGEIKTRPGIKYLIVEARRQTGEWATLCRVLLRMVTSYGQVEQYQGGLDVYPKTRATNSPFVISGWFADENIRPAHRMQLKIGRQVIQCKPRMRPDVTKYLNIDDSSIAYGYSEEIKVKFGLKRVIFEIETASGFLHVPYKKFHWFGFRKKLVAMSSDRTSYGCWLKDDAKQNPYRLPPEKGPLISVLMPVYNTPAIWLKRAIESVRSQTCQNWELCIADDASSMPHVKEILSEYAKIDKRIKVAYREINGHISVASNTALNMCNGIFTALLDHDDELEASALSEVANAIIDNPNSDIIYSDEDKINASGDYCSPFFKPDFDWDLLMGCNYICHLLVIKTKVLKEIGGFRMGLEGSQDHDLLLRAIRVSNIVVHIPRILYHWRMHDQSIAKTGDAKPYAHTAGMKALQDHLDHIMEGSAKISALSGLYSYRVIYEIKNQPRVSIIIPFKDKPKLLETCVLSILNKTNYKNYELILVDNNSVARETRDLLDRLVGIYKNIKVLNYQEPFNFSKINNLAANMAQGEHLLFLNNDTEVINSEWLDELLMHSQRSEVGAVGALLFYPNNTVQHAGVVLGMTGLAGHIFTGQRLEEQPLLRFVREVTAVTAACMMTKKELYLRAGGMDPELTVCGNDVDLCLRYRQMGYHNIFTPHARLYHYESTTRDPHAIPHKDFVKSVGIYAPYLRGGDCFYNVNRSLTHTDGRLRGFDEPKALAQAVRSVFGEHSVFANLIYQTSVGPRETHIKKLDKSEIS